MASEILNRVSKLIPAEVMLKAYYALIYSKLIHGILSWGKSSNGNKVMMEKTIKSAWKVVSYDNLDICKGLFNFDSVISLSVILLKKSFARSEGLIVTHICLGKLPCRIQGLNTIQGLVQLIVLYLFILKVSVINHFCTNLFMYGTTYLCIL